MTGACPNCHVFKGIWSPLTMNSEGIYSCRIEVTHKYTRDSQGNYHSV